MEYQHGGDIYTNRVALDYSANINPLGLPEGVKRACMEAFAECSVYPDSRCGRLTSALSAFHGVSREWIVCGNGAAELIFLIAQAAKPKRALLIAPSFLEYEQALRAVECGITWFDLTEEEGFCLSIPRLLERLKAEKEGGRLPDLIFLCNPNNPTGLALEREELAPLLEFCEENAILCVVDECFCEFLEEPERHSVMEELRSGRFTRLFILKAFTKIYAMAGLRLGYGICADPALLESMGRFRQPWSVSGPAQAAGIAALLETGYVKETRRLIRQERAFLREQLKRLGFFIYDSAANYLFFKDVLPEASGSGCEQLPKGLLYEECLRAGVLIRSCANYRGLDSRYYRICVKDHASNEQLLAVLAAIIEERNEQAWQRRS